MVEVRGITPTTTELRSGRQVPTGELSVPHTGDPIATAVMANPPVIVLAHPRDPGTFCGTDEVDVEDWVRTYERVSNHNRWDATVMLANLHYHLKGTAKDWFETHEDQITSWDTCKEKLIDLFGKSAARQLAAKQKLSTRAQSSTESYIAYIQDVLTLCHKVDNQMTETEKVGHVLKGIADDAFNLLVFKNCATVDEIIKECRRFEQAKSKRIVQQFTRLPNTAATSSCEDLFPPAEPLRPTVAGSSSENVTKIIRRELEAIALAPKSQRDVETPAPMVSVIQNVVHEELMNLGLHPMSTISRPSPNAPHICCDHAARSSYGAPRFRSRNPADWRTPDDKPICFNCGRAGHISRYCRAPRFPQHQNSTNRIPYDGSRRFSSFSQPQFFDTPAQTTYRVGRSPSPQLRRQSRSPRRPSPSTNYVRNTSEN